MPLPERHLRKGIMTTFIGVALLIGLSFIGYRDGTWIPGPWLLGGLIPMFVGLAQVIGALLAGAEFPRSRTPNIASPRPLQVKQSAPASVMTAMPHQTAANSAGEPSEPLPKDRSSRIRIRWQQEIWARAYRNSR